MIFNHVSTLDIPQQATELTTSDLKLICGAQGQEHNVKHNKLKKHFKRNKLKNLKNDTNNTNDNSNNY